MVDLKIWMQTRNKVKQAQGQQKMREYGSVAKFFQINLKQTLSKKILKSYPLFTLCRGLRRGDTMIPKD